MFLFYSFSIYLIVYPHEWLMWLFDLVDFPYSYKLRILGYGACHFIICWLVERFIMIWWGRTILDKLIGICKRKKKSVEKLIELSK